MVKAEFKRGQLLDVTLLGVNLTIPPFDLTLFDTDWIIRGVEGLFAPREDIWQFGDVNRDGIINDADVEIIIQLSGLKRGDPGYLADADLNGDGAIDSSDLGIVGINYGMDRRGGTITQFITTSINTVLTPLFTAIPNAVWNLTKGTLDSWAQIFYEKHCTYEEYVKEREQQKQ